MIIRKMGKQKTPLSRGEDEEGEYGKIRQIPASQILLLVIL
jgi:hypothetical protein